jgi:large subunit ribosomal protein L23
MKHSSDVIKAILRTEKSTTLYEPLNKYIFLVDKSCNKIQIKRAIEEIYKVKVSQVNTFVSSGKLKRVRYQLGKTPDTKRAVVTLKEGQKITEV